MSDTGVSVWLRHPASSPTDPPVLVTHEDTLKRCLSDGWSQVEAPTPAAVPDPAEPAQPEPASRARRVKADTKVKEA